MIVHFLHKSTSTKNRHMALQNKKHQKYGLAELCTIVSDLQALKYNFNALTHDVFDTVEQTEKNVLNLKFSKSVYLLLHCCFTSTVNI